MLFVMSILSLCVYSIHSEILSMITTIKEQRHSIIVTFVSFNIKAYAILNTYIDSSHFIIINEKSLPQKEKQMINFFDKYNSTSFITDIKVGDYFLHNFHLSITSHSIKYLSDVGLSLSFKSPNNCSLIERLYNDNVISSKSFGFHRRNINEGEFFIGGIDKNKLLNCQNKATLNIEDDKHWILTINNIQYESKKKEMNLKCIIHTGMSEMVVSNELYEYIKEVVMKLPITNGDCIERKGEMNTTKLICLSSGYFFTRNTFLEIKISNVLFRIKLDLLFQSDINNSLYIESKVVTNQYDTKCYLGSSFINLFDYSIFDSEHKQIQLFSSNNDIQIKTNSLNAIIFCLISLMYILIINIIFILYIKRIFHSVVIRN